MTKKKQKTVPAGLAESVSASMPRRRTKAERAARGALLAGSIAPPDEPDPLRELRRLCREHLAWSKRRQALLNMSGDKRRKLKPGEVLDFELPDGRRVPASEAEVGTTVVWGPKTAVVKARSAKGIELHVPCPLPHEVVRMIDRPAGEHGEADPGGVVQGLSRQIEGLEKRMRDLLRGVPVFRDWLSGVFGFAEGWVLGSYLVCFVDVVRGGRDGRQVGAGERRPAADPALTSAGQIVRYCGWACVRGRLERPTRGVKLAYNGELRKRCWQWMFVVSRAFGRGASGRATRCPEHAEAAAQEACPACAATEAPHGYSCKYEDVRAAVVAREPPREGEAEGARLKRARQKGVAVAIATFLEDFYTVSRAMSGLPVSPTRYARALGYAHAGEVRQRGPVPLSLERALDLVGSVGKVPRASAREVSDETGAADGLA